METVSVTLDIPESFINACEANNISEYEVLQIFVTMLSTLCTVLTGNEKLLIGQVTKVFKDYVDITTTIPLKDERKIKVCSKMMQTVLAMAVTETVKWSEKKYIRLINDACNDLMKINKHR